MDKFENIETVLLSQPEDNFPYIKQYKDLKGKLLPFHTRVEKGALLDSVTKWRQDLLTKIEEIKNGTNSEDEIKKLQYLIEQDPAIYLNQHGINHVNKVIEKVSELISHFLCDKPTPFETFILLCAIQIHDVGNIFGRVNHETNFQDEFNKLFHSVFSDSTIRIYIFRIARVHSGNIDGDDDTLSSDSLGGYSTRIFNEEVRCHLLAALLRFGDEMADDSSRADSFGLEYNLIPDQSKIFHKYSQSLHSVKIDVNDVNKTLFLSLDYSIDAESIAIEYNKNNNKKLLIDEIFTRTIKMERERRYCMRFLGQYLPLFEIKVKIEIVPNCDLTSSEKVTYTLSEKGYPLNDKIDIDCQNNTGEKVIETLKNKGWTIE